MPQTSSRASSRRGRISEKLVRAGIIAFLLTVIVTIGILYAFNRNRGNEEQTTTESGKQDASVSETPEEKIPEFIDLQPEVDEWLKTVNAEVGLMIYDLDNQRVAAAYHENEVFNAASIYKLFYVYAGYRQIDQGNLNGEAYFATTSDYRGDDYSLYQCLDLMIRESYNGCADHMRGQSEYDILAQNLINELALENTTGLGLYSTAEDLTKLLSFYYEHTDLSANSWARISDSMLNQPPTTVSANVTYDWRQGLPAGFSERVKVYDKVGWAYNGRAWTVYDDAAIVEFPELNRHYIVVALTSGITTDEPTPLINLGRLIEETVFAKSN